MKKIFNNRYDVISLFFVVVGIIILIQLVNLQIIKGKEYDDLSQRRLLRERDIAAPRGNITDRNGISLAVNRIGFIVQIVNTGIKSDALNEIILKVIKIFEKNNDSYDNTLSKYLTFNPIKFSDEILGTEGALGKWESEMGLKDSEWTEVPADFFKYFRKKFNISDKYTDEEAYKIMTIRYEMLIKGCTSLNPLSFARDVSKESVVEIEERHLEFPGISTDMEPLRRYVDPTIAAHIMGYVGNIDSEEYKKLKDKGYGYNDIIGKSGIEVAAEEYLRGTKGEKKVEVDTNGRQTKEIIGVAAVPGDDVVLTLDSKLQKVAIESLKKNIEAIRKQADYKRNFGDAFAGAVVALDVNSGEVLAMASYPTYDPSVYIAGTDDKEAQKQKYALLNDKQNAPLLNRAIQGIYIPGSTYKPLTAIAGLQEGIITPESTIRDTGVANIGGWNFYCLEFRMGLGAHGDLNLERALATSCNIYFHELGAKVTIDKLDKWAKLFGLGEYTGIDIPGEKKGIRANKESKEKLRKDIWRPADTAQVAIGQFDNSFTPIQLANYVSTIANGGKKYKPHLIKKVLKYDGSMVTETKPEYETISVNPDNIKAVRKGMIAVTNAVDGTAVQVFKDFPFKVAGKTGTPETGGESIHSSNSLFVCYAPADDPKIAIAVVIERGVWGANSAPIACDVLREYFGLNNSAASLELRGVTSGD